MHKSFFLVTVLVSALTLAASTVALAQGYAQSDPAAVVKQHGEAIARGDVAGALALYTDDLPPYTFFLLNGDIELNRNRQLFV